MKRSFIKFSQSLGKIVSIVILLIGLGSIYQAGAAPPTLPEPSPTSAIDVQTKLRTYHTSELKPSQAEDHTPNKEQNITGSNQRIIEFAGRQWVVKSGCGLGPGPNCWSDNEGSVWVEGGQLHLKLRNINGAWYAAEVSTKICTQYGMHRFFTIGWLDQLDQNVVAALFLYKDDQTEIDIEFGKWGQPNPAYNAQYVVQPWDKPGNRERFPMKLNGTFTTHYIDWQPSSIQFKSIHGHHQEPPTPGHLIHEWLYTGNDIPTKEDSLKIHINLWLYQGKPPTDGQEVELIVKNAQLPPPGCTKQVYLPIIVKDLSDVLR